MWGRRDMVLLNFKEWLSEAWAPHSLVTKGLGAYLSQPKHSVLDVWDHFLAWPRSADIAEELGVDIHGDMYAAAEKIDRYMNQQGLWDGLHDFVMARAPSDAPTHMFMGARGAVPRQTWLTHFSDDADSISGTGFTSGVSDYGRLGLTYGMSRGERELTGDRDQAMNFAFVSGSRDSAAAARAGKYGRDAVMFMAPAQLAYHYGDEEEQAIFHGSSVRPRDMVLLTKGDGGWTVRSKDLSRRDPFVAEDFAKAERWVMDNWRQYQRVIMS